jgi:hypothetical protein
MPYEPRLRRRARELERKTGIKSLNYFEQFLSETEDAVARARE